MSRLEAKMIGMTPAWLTFRGRNCRVPPKTRRPRTCLADWVGIRRWLSVIAMTPTTTAMNRPSRSRSVMMPYLPGSGVSFEVEFSHSPFMATGTRARIPAMISRLIPLPIPNSSICSPIHIRKIVPAVMMQTHTTPCQKSRYWGKMMPMFGLMM